MIREDCKEVAKQILTQLLNYSCNGMKFPYISRRTHEFGTKRFVVERNWMTFLHQNGSHG
ncbi:hypothetical protein LR48_Vigan661s002300 [Vigna angularis]|uniref:Uncharacterized protein n=1 Tax=Phaseolus angularis TaxID=3914 RepID=A0A0L9TFZ7_PHAAN|nr:hypothetical protein LR48_Vigan661s002300 [Vigna angularis]